MGTTKPVRGAEIVYADCVGNKHACRPLNCNLLATALRLHEAGYTVLRMTYRPSTSSFDPAPEFYVWTA